MSSKENNKKEEEKEEKKEIKKEKRDNLVLGAYLKHVVLFLIVIFILIGLVIFLGKEVVDLKKEVEKENSLYVSKVEFKSLGQLVTQSARVTVVKRYKNSREFLKLFDIPFTEYVLIFSYDVSVDAYIDFEKVHYTRNDNEKKFYVEIPHAKNKDPILYEESVKTWYDNKNIFNSVDFDKSNELRIEVKNKGLEEALKQGLLDKAEKNAELLISNMLKTDEQCKNYDVEFNYIGG